MLMENICDCFVMKWFRLQESLIIICFIMYYIWISDDLMLCAKFKHVSIG